jgi:hypothetical protein
MVIGMAKTSAVLDLSTKHLQVITSVARYSSFIAAAAALGPIDIQDSHRESVLIHCASDQPIRSAKHGEAIRAQ